MRRCLAVVRVKPRGCSQQSSQDRCLVGGDIARRGPEIALRRRFDPIGASPEINSVEIEREDLILVEFVFEMKGEEYLLNLALEGFFRREKGDLR